MTSPCRGRAHTKAMRGKTSPDIYRLTETFILISHDKNSSPCHWLLYSRKKARGSTRDEASNNMSCSETLFTHPATNMPRRSHGNTVYIQMPSIAIPVSRLYLCCATQTGKLYLLRGGGCTYMYGNKQLDEFCTVCLGFGIFFCLFFLRDFDQNLCNLTTT